MMMKNERNFLVSESSYLIVMSTLEHDKSLGQRNAILRCGEILMKKFTYQQVRDESLVYFDGDDLAAEVFASKYALQDLSGQWYESSPDDMHKRLAREFARIEQNYPNSMSYDEIYELFANWDVVPQGSPMSAIGNPFQYQSLSNCFVIEPPYDSIGGIFRTTEQLAQIMKRRGGVGFDISTIRPKGVETANAARTTDGIGVFMEQFSTTTRGIAQGGRRGALMLTISVHHPEIRTFINIKRDKKKVTGANISIRLTDEFMNAVKNDEPVQLRFPVEKDVKHSVSEYVSAKELWHEIISAAHESAEPGLLFWDTVHRRGPADIYRSFLSSSTNPCGEICLSPFDSCRLLLVNLANFVIDPFTSNARFDFPRYAAVVQKAQQLMDDLIDLELEAIEKIVQKIQSDPEPDDIKSVELNLWQDIQRVALLGRRTGLGITALGDTLAYLGIKYGSDESVEMTGKIYKNLAINAYRKSIDMARDRRPFPAYDYSLESGHEFIEQIMSCDDEMREDYGRYGRRNIALTTTAPAGSVSILTQTTSGCEPAFLTSYKRRRKINPGDQEARVDFVDAMGDKWQEYTVYHPGFKKWMDVTGETDPTKSPYWGATSNDINWVKKIDVQAAAQKWICHAISNTTNIPSDTTVDVVKDVYMRGWETGCKGVTIYRDGSRDGVLLKDDTPSEQGRELIIETHAPKRPKELQCDIHRAVVKGVQYLVFVGLMDGRPYEIFAGLSEQVEVPKKAARGYLVKNGKKSGVTTYNLRIEVEGEAELLFKDIVDLFDNPVYGAFTRTLSLALRHGVPVQYLVEQLRKDKHSDVTSFSSVIARVLGKSYIADGTVPVHVKSCPKCGATSNLRYEQGCVTCFDCGNSKCSLYLDHWSFIHETDATTIENY